MCTSIVYFPSPRPLTGRGQRPAFLPAEGEGQPLALDVILGLVPRTHGSNKELLAEGACG